jgi:hypothetical protein
MKNWVAMAQALGLPLSAPELDRLVQPLAALEVSFQPLLQHLTPDMEPDFELHVGEVGGEGGE